MDGPSGASTFRTSADAYDRLVGRYTDELAARLLDAAGIEPGMRALDIGCGPGAVTRALAARVGARNVAAVEPSESFADACRARVPGADVRNGAAEELPFDDDSFDAVVSQLVLNFMTDAEAAVREMRRVAAPGAIVAAAVWDYAGGMTFLRRLWDAALRVDSDGAAARDEGRVMRYCSPPELEALWSGAGLSGVRTDELHAGASYDDFDDLWQPLETGIGPSGSYVMSLDADKRAAVRRTMYELLGSPNGPFTLNARAWFVAGRA
jgi:SAM-dependent methyltransferase